MWPNAHEKSVQLCVQYSNWSILSESKYSSLPGYNCGPPSHVLLDHSPQNWQYLIKLKKKHSKSAGLSEDYSLQNYLASNELTTDEKQLLFQFRTRTYPCKTNYRTQHAADLSCTICKEEDTPEHLLQCERITSGVDTSGITYGDIFGPTAKQIKIAKILKKISLNRSKIMNTSPSDGSQVHPQWCLICNIY